MRGRSIYSTLVLDLRLQYRNGFYLVILLALVVSMILLAQLPTELIDRILPLFLFTNLIIGTFLFMGALVLYEINQNIHLALNVSPISPHVYVWSKVGTLTVLAGVEGSILILFIDQIVGLNVNLVLLILGVIGVSLIFCLSGFIVVARYSDFNSYMSKGVGLGMFLSIPFVTFFFNNQVVEIMMAVIPTNSILVIMSSDHLMTETNFLHGIIFVAWLCILSLAAVRSYELDYEQRRIHG